MHMAAFFCTELWRASFCQRAASCSQQLGTELGSGKSPACLKESAAGTQGDNVPGFGKINKEWEISGFLLLFGITNDHSMSLRSQNAEECTGKFCFFPMQYWKFSDCWGISLLVKSWYCYAPCCRLSAVWTGALQSRPTPWNTDFRWRLLSE